MTQFTHFCPAYTEHSDGAFQGYKGAVWVFGTGHSRSQTPRPAVQLFRNLNSFRRYKDHLQQARNGLNARINAQDQPRIFDIATTISLFYYEHGDIGNKFRDRRERMLDRLMESWGVPPKSRRTEKSRIHDEFVQVASQCIRFDFSADLSQETKGRETGSYNITLNGVKSKVITHEIGHQVVEQQTVSEEAEKSLSDQNDLDEFRKKELSQ